MWLSKPLIKANSLWFIFNFFLVGLITGCKTPALLSTEWTTYPYEFSCKVYAPPVPPCVNDWSGNGFEYTGEFNACKTDVLNYEAAIQSWSRCANEDVRVLLDGVNSAVREAFVCLDEKYLAGEVNEAMSCPSVTIPREIESYSIMSTTNVLHYADTIDFTANVPTCVREGYRDFESQYGYEFLCRDELMSFLDPSSNVSAQRQYNKFVSWMNVEVPLRVNTVVDQFNCVAERKYICTLPLF